MVEEAGFAAVEEVVLVVAARGGVALYAALMREEDNVRVCVLCANGVVLEEEALNKADMPLCVGLATMVFVSLYFFGGLELGASKISQGTSLTRSHDLMGARTSCNGWVCG